MKILIFRRFYFVWLLFIGVSLGCHAMVVLTDKEKVINEFVLNGFLPALPLNNQKSNMLKHLIKRFGQPISKSTNVVDDDREPGVKNENSIYEFDGAIVKTTIFYLENRKPTNDSLLRESINFISITSSKYTLKHEFKIGSDKKDFVDILGDYKNRINKFILSYGTRNTATGGVEIYFDEFYKAKKITWEFYSD